LKIKLVKNCINPVDLSIGSARTCYSQDLKEPEEISNWDKKESLLQDLFKSGHHTTLQHYNFTFLMSGISRLSIWRFFHSHRFYNSDQVSQRYTEVKSESFLYLNDRIEVYHDSLINKYKKISDLLIVDFEKSSNPVERKLAKKKAMENARYILPQSVKANMYHTINLSTLLRYHEGKSLVKDCQEEIVEIVENMVNLVLEEYPELKSLFSNTKEKEECNIYNKEIISFYKKNLKTELENIYIPESQNNNLFYGDTSGMSALFNQEIGNSSITFNLLLSLSADSQNQRHRTAYGIRPELTEIIKRGYYANIDNYYIPEAIRKNKIALDIFVDAILESILILNREEDKYKSYLLLNAFKIPIKETSSALDFIHKAEKRLCLNSQEEILELTRSMVEEIKNSGYEKYAKELTVPPCVKRARSNIGPICPEGPRFCGVKEWKSKKYI